MRLQGAVRTLIAVALMFCLGATVHAQVASDPARPKTWGRDYNARSTDLGDGRMQTQFHAKWINYLDEDRTWREIDPNFVETATGFEMTKAPFEVRVPLTARGAATFVNKNRWDVRERRLIDEPPLEQTMRALGVEDVPGRIERGNKPGQDILASSGD